MDERTLTALRGSIEKWEGIVAGEIDDDAADNCPLCELFYECRCLGCPVNKKSGGIFCRETPYEDRLKADRPTGDTPEAVKAAQAMLDFLESLLPAGADSTNHTDGG